jgi:glutathione-independent formaldehyde dehydrogenase
MADNRGVVYLGPGHVEVQAIDYPKLENPAGKKIDHGVILKVVTTNICGSDQHMVRGRTTAPKGLVLGHEITGEIIEKGKDVEYLEIGDLVTVPFNVACGRCRTCREQQSGVCLNVNPSRAGGAYGYVDMGGWVGGQADYVMVPYADGFPRRCQRWSGRWLDGVHRGRGTGRTGGGCLSADTGGSGSVDWRYESGTAGTCQVGGL